MPFYGLDARSTLKDYYRVFVMICPLTSIVPFFVLLVLVLHVSAGVFARLYVTCTGIAVLLGAPLFHWARGRWDSVKDARAIVLASGLTVLLASAPLYYYLIMSVPGFELLPAIGALSVVVIPWIALYVKPPRGIYWRVQGKRGGKDQ